jgi:exodeoxyribonuclease VII large subunit
MREVLSLYELNLILRSTIETAFPETFLVTAEIARIKLNRHCFLELVDRDEETIRAQMNAVIWSDRYEVISRQFREAAGIGLTKGIKILFEAYVNFHERYGLKLNIIDIDPSYTIGELALRRREILRRLEREGLKDRNREIGFPLVPQRVGIISSPTAAGYEDMMMHLINNPYGYRFTCRLYEAVMQGDGAEASVVDALRRCYEDSQYLDVIVIVRGGGSRVDLHCFDSYEIARMISEMPVPVISGIGHERDVTVVDEVSNMRAKTPTAVADILITRVKDFEDSLDSLSHRLFHASNRLLLDEKAQLTAFIKSLDSALRREIVINAERLARYIRGLKLSVRFLQSRERHIIQEATKLRLISFNNIRAEAKVVIDLWHRIKDSVHRRIQTEDRRIKAREDNLNHLDPRNVLKRGYSITRRAGVVIRSINDVGIHDIIDTTLYDGNIQSVVRAKGDQDGKDTELQGGD